MRSAQRLAALPLPLSCRFRATLVRLPTPCMALSARKASPHLAPCFDIGMRVCVCICIRQARHSRQAATCPPATQPPCRGMLSSCARHCFLNLYLPHAHASHRFFFAPCRHCCPPQPGSANRCTWQHPLSNRQARPPSPNGKQPRKHGQQRQRRATGIHHRSIQRHRAGAGAAPASGGIPAGAGSAAHAGHSRLGSPTRHRA